MTKRGLVMLLVILGAGCGRRFVARIAPQHQVLIFDGASYEPSHLRSTCLAWLDAAIDRPGSSLTLCAGGAGRRGKCAAPIIIPVWRVHVLRAKASFRRDLPNLIEATLRAKTTWRPPGDDLGDGATVALLSGTETPPCWWERSKAATRSPIHEIVLCDVSSSAGTAVCDITGLQAEYDRFLLEGGMAPESSFAIMRIGHDLASTRELYRFVTPTTGRALCALAVLNAHHAIERVALPDPSAGSAILEAVYIAAGAMHDLRGDFLLVLRTDLQQVTLGQWNFERDVPKAAPFIDELRRDRLLPPLNRVRVEICGTHFRGPGGRALNAQADAALKTTWDEMLLASGAASVHFSARCAGGTLTAAQEGE